ncbi:MAG: outer membrane protein assembly factor BamA [Opitutales bacterium]
MKTTERLLTKECPARSWLFSLAPLLACLLAATAAAQPTFPTEEPPTVNSIEVEFVGVRNVSEQNILAHILLREGEPFSLALADQSIRSLYESGNFENIQVRQSPAGDNRIDLTFVVTPLYRISGIRFRGNQKVDTDDLEDEIELEVGQALDRQRVNRAAVAIFDYLQERGFSNARVTFEIERNEAEGTGEVIFLVEEGQRFEINDIDFRGNTAFSEGELENVMETQEYIFLWSLIVGNGRLVEGQLEDDLELLREHYRDAGYLDVRIDPAAVEFLYPDEEEVDIIITIDEGRQYTVGEISFADHTLFNTEVLRAQLDLQPGDVFSPTQIEEAKTAIRDFYGRFGYLDAFPRVERSPNMETGAIDVTFRISEGERYHVESINIQGNTKTRSDVIVRELALAPGDVFDLVRMKTSEARLRNTRFFESVNLSPEEVNVPNRRNLRINVEEGRTGSINFGAGFSTLESIVAFAEFQQTNFDLFAWNNYFMGGGQKLRIRVSVGLESNTFILSFEEPWLFQRRLAFGFELFRQQSDFLSNDYDELRTGLELYLRRRLFELVDARLSYRIEEVQIEDVSPFASTAIQEEEGSRLVSKAGFGLSRDTRNRFTWTTTGNRVSADWQIAGLGGDTYYLNQEYRATQFFPLFEEPFEQSLRIHGRTGTIFDYTNGRVPFFDRYFLGGPYTIRGFGFRDIGPRDSSFNDPIGGNTMALGQAEYTIRLAQPFGLALFYDVGFVNDDAFDWSPADYADSWGFGARVDIMGAPLNLDFAWPITRPDFEEGGLQFHFSFGTVF